MSAVIVRRRHHEPPFLFLSACVGVTCAARLALCVEEVPMGVAVVSSNERRRRTWISPEVQLCFAQSWSGSFKHTTSVFFSVFSVLFSPFSLVPTCATMALSASKKLGSTELSAASSPTLMFRLVHGARNGGDKEGRKGNVQMNVSFSLIHMKLFALLPSQIHYAPDETCHLRKIAENPIDSPCSKTTQTPRTKQQRRTRQAQNVSTKAKEWMDI